jgi:endonuclease/exonuclease/phosphatase family metal-dependent hydrolase
MPTRPRARALTALTAAAAAVVATAALTLAGDAHEASRRQTYLHFNLCGNTCNGGTLAVVTGLEGLIHDRRPFAITLNEICENQYDRLRTDLDHYAGQFDPTGETCRNGTRYGNAVLVRTETVDLVGSWALPDPAGDEIRRLMCASARAPAMPLAVCVTHISNVSGNIAAQVRAIAGMLRWLDAENAVLLGGDFNTDPSDPRMDPLYRGCGGTGVGALREADSAGCASRSMLSETVGTDVINEDTYGRHKFDYVFLSAGDWSSVDADATESATSFSDHDALWVEATPSRPDVVGRRASGTLCAG